MPPSAEREGVIKFDCRFQLGSPPDEGFLQELNAWRKIFRHLALIGQDSERYEGLGFGNLSHRLGDASGFVISGTQTGGICDLDAKHYSLVRHCDPMRNLVEAEGTIKPSSESLTHGALYRLAPDIRCVIHVHSPHIWRQAKRLGLPITAEHAPYGTPAMAEEIARLWRDGPGFLPGIIIMAGHEDGVVAFGTDIESAGALLLSTLARAYALDSPQN